MATIIEAPGNLISNLTNEREVAQRKLDECIKKKELVELHTHLLGMGSADFWVNNIMKTYLPRVCQPIYDQDDEEKVTMLLNHLKTLMKDMLVMSRTEPNLTEYLGQKPNNADDMSCECLEQHEIDWTLFPTAGEGYIDVFLPHYTYDVVFDWKSLCQIFHVDIKDADLKKREEIPFQRMMTNLESKLGKHGLIKGYIIFNARKRRFESVYGITNSNLINIIQDEKSGQSPLAYVRNAFAMLNRNGEAPDEPDLDTYRGNFTPAFYPHRFQFKDCIYQQRLEVLSILLYDVCLHYAKAGVNYIEFSMGVGDMLNVDIWKHLNDAFPSEFLKWHPDKGNNSGNDGKPKPPTAGRVEQNRKRKITEDTDSTSVTASITVNESDLKKSRDQAMSTTGESDRRKKPSTKVVRQWANILGLNEPKPIGQTCRFLVAFNRNKIKEFKDKSINELLEQMMKRGEKYCTLEGESLDQYIFDMFNLKDADKMLKIARHLQKWKEHGWEKNSVRDILGLTNREEQLLKFWRKSVVGIDWVGDELGHPYCALTHSIFIGQDGIANKMRSVQEEFGIRVHCGESLPFPTVWKEDNVLEHAFNMHIKILHCDLERLYNGLSEKRLRIGHGVAFLQKNSNPANNALAFIKENGIVCELNMTSNLHLLHHATYNYDKHEYALKEFLINGVKVILSTDDDGIWTIDKCQKHRRHVSVAYEYCTAIEHDMFKDHLNKLEEMFDNAKSCRFGKPDVHRVTVEKQVNRLRYVTFLYLPRDLIVQ